MAPVLQQRSRLPIAAAVTYARAHAERFVAELMEVVRFPSVSTQPRHANDVRNCADWPAKHLRLVGLENGAVARTGARERQVEFPARAGSRPSRNRPAAARLSRSAHAADGAPNGAHAIHRAASADAAAPSGCAPRRGLTGRVLAWRRCSCDPEERVPWPACFRKRSASPRSRTS